MQATLISKIKTNSKEGISKEEVFEFSQKKQLDYTFTTLSNSYLEILHYVVSRVLNEYHLSFLKNPLLVILREILNNSIKANLKRAMFAKNNVSLDKKENPEEYQRVLKVFREEAIPNLNKYKTLMQSMDLKVNIQILTDEKGILVCIRNSGVLNYDETQGIQRAFENIKRYNTILEVLENNNEDTSEEVKPEGAGLGLIMLLFLLKEIGVSSRNFHIESNIHANQTKVVLFIPCELKQSQKSILLYRKILNEIKMVPTFPDHIQKLIDLSSQAQVDIQSITNKLIQEPFLVTSLLRMVNSGSFYHSNGHKRIDNVFKAITIIGLKNLKQMLMYHSACAILSKRYRGSIEKWMNHSQKCALYAWRIANYTGNRQLVDIAYLGALLHDIGKVILHSIADKNMRKKQDMYSKSNTSSAQNTLTALEEIDLGIAHTQVGAYLAKKWNFSECIIEIILCHHAPFTSRREFRKEVSIVHLADAFASVPEQGFPETYFELDAQAELGINNNKQLREFYTKVSKI